MAGRPGVPDYRGEPRCRPERRPRSTLLDVRVPSVGQSERGRLRRQADAQESAAVADFTERRSTQARNQIAAPPATATRITTAGTMLPTSRDMAPAFAYTSTIGAVPASDVHRNVQRLIDDKPATTLTVSIRMGKARLMNTAAAP